MTVEMQRVSRNIDLGLAHRGFDLSLGLAAMVPLVACAVAVWFVPAIPASLARRLAVIWGGCLLAFFGGVRRGLTFSEAGGGQAGEIVTMLGLFALAIAALILGNPLIGAVGLAGVGVLDAMAARRGQVPRYFLALRPPQMAVAAVALVLVKVGAG
jgi:hypothetical protein